VDQDNGSVPVHGKTACEARCTHFWYGRRVDIQATLVQGHWIQI
jgi:hypothetical protein